MYTLKLESLNSNYNKELNVETLDELFNDNAPLHEELEDFKLSGLYDDLGYSLVILKPYNDDFLIVYVNKLLFGMNDGDFPQKIKGKCYGEVFPKLKKLNNLDKLNEVYSNDSHSEFIFKIFDGKKLIFAGKQNYIRQDDYLYYFVKDETSDYIIKENYELVFKNSSFPIFIIDKDKNIIKANYAFLQNVNYSLNELNHLNINNFISQFESSEENINSFDEALDKLFSKELVIVNCEGKIINRKSNFKWFKASLRLKTSDTIEIIYQDITKNKIVERNNDFLSIFLEDLQKETKTALTILDEDGFHWSDEIFNILEVPTEKRVYDYGKENIILKHTISSDKHIITDAIESLSPEKNIVNFIYKVKTDNGNYKYLKTIIKNLYEENSTVTVSFTQDVTEEEVAKKNSIDAMKNLRTITTNNKMAIVIFKNGSYTISPEFYEMLEINQEDFSQNIDLMEYFALPDEKIKYKSQKESLSPENPLIHYSLTSKILNNKIKYFDGFIEAEFDEEGNAFKSVNFIRDVTEETLVKQETLALKEGLDAVAEFSKIAIVSYNDGKYRWSDELFNM
jgi:PAS domain S-box-containing protein